MKKIIHCFILSIGILLTQNALAKDIQVEATGHGQDRNWAIADAIDNAIRQRSEVTIEREKPMKKIDVSGGAIYTKEKEGTSQFDAKGKLNAKGGFDGKKGNLQADGDYQQNKSYNDKETHQVSTYFKDNSKEIPVKYQGSIKSYDILSEEKKEGLFIVTIKATLFQECRPLTHCSAQKDDCLCYSCKGGYKLLNEECLPCEDKENCGCADGRRWSKERQECVYDSHDYKSTDLIKKSNYSLAIMPFEFRKSFNCLGQKISDSELNTLVSNQFVENMTSSKKFNLLDRNHQKSYEKEMALITGDMTLPENKIKLKNMVSADYILVGTIENFSATTDKKYVEFTGETIYSSSASLKLSYRLLETATMEIVSSGSSEKSINKDGQFSSCYNVENQLLDKATTEASNRLLQDVFPDYQPKKIETSSSETKIPKKAAPKPVIQLPFD